jgi:hypothetical protein
MFLLGEYSEYVARDIADHLKGAGMKVDTRTFTISYLELFNYLEGRMSVLKGELSEKDYASYERYIIALRNVLAAGASPEDFTERYQLELDPQVNEKRKQFCEPSEEAQSEDEREARRKKHEEIMADLIDVSNAESFIDLVLDRNDIEIGEDVGSKLDDPILRIFDDYEVEENEEDDEEKSELAKTTTVFTVEPRAQIFVDEFSAVLTDELDEAFKDEYKREYARLALLGKLISELEEPSSGKIDMEAFRERCELVMEKNGDLLEIDGCSAAEELARSLEKNGIIKVKGESVKWRR